jgi:hypothetical protein
MHWLYPAFLAAGIGAVLPFALHLLRGRASRPLPLPSIRFLRQQAASTRFHRFQRWFVLLCRAAVFVLLAAAFARPYLTSYVSASRTTVVVVDNSFSMQAAGRATRARETALRALGPLRPGETIGVLRMNPQPGWIVPLTSDAAAARTALETFEPGWEATRIDPAVRLAADVLAANSAEERRLIVLTDHQRNGWVGADFSRKLPEGVDVLFSQPEAVPAGQGFVSRATVTRQPDGGLAVDAVIGAAPGAAQSRIVRVFLENGQTPALETTVQLSGGEQREVRLALPAREDAGWVRVMLDPDALPADDCAFAIAPIHKDRAYRVMLDAGRPGEFDHLAAALGAMRQLKPGLESAALPSEAAWPPDAAVVLRSPSSFDGALSAKLDAFLAAGGKALVFASRDVAACPWWKNHDIALGSVDATDAVTLREWNAEHSLVAPLARRGLRGLVGWQFRRAQALPAAVVQPIGYWSTGLIAVGEARLGGGLVVICGFSADRTDGDLPTESAFVPFVHRALAYLLEPDAASERATRHRVGETIVLPPGPGTWRRVDGPAAAGGSREIEGEVAVDQPGVYAFEQPGGVQLYAVNVAADESDLSPWAPGEPWHDLVPPTTHDARGSGVPRAALAAADAEQKNGLWGWFFLAVGCLLLVELTAGNRTTR